MTTASHPAATLTTVTCTTCGTEHVLRSTRALTSVDVCSACHPVYTGSERRTTTGGRIARFEARRAGAAPRSARTAPSR